MDLRTLREFYLSATADRRLRAVARSAGVTHTALANFLGGAMPSAENQERLRAYAAEHHADVSPSQGGQLFYAGAFHAARIAQKEVLDAVNLALMRMMVRLESEAMSNLGKVSPADEADLRALAADASPPPAAAARGAKPRSRRAG